MASMDKMFTETATSDTGQLAKERLVWSLQPILTVVVIFCWVLNPEVVDQADLEKVSLWGFLFGACIGLLGFKEKVISQLSMKLESGIYQKNRVPEEFYWGYKTKKLFERKD
ncbi:MAG: hypothetical protein OXR68_01590 [Alphaproteobacteria bacterium]|nr:hypothetical protein [Alphaproteobacteria bacterium]MDD9919305.1 hypothetical protein [Alphaproteobacteria bacterium]